MVRQAWVTSVPVVGCRRIPGSHGRSVVSILGNPPPQYWLNGPSNSWDSPAFAVLFLRAVCFLAHSHSDWAEVQPGLWCSFLMQWGAGWSMGQSSFFSLIHSLLFSRFKVSCRHWWSLCSLLTSGPLLQLPNRDSSFLLASVTRLGVVSTAGLLTPEWGDDVTFVWTP